MGKKTYEKRFLKRLSFRVKSLKKIIRRYMVNIKISHDPGIHY
jgi:hypothetical protein